MEQAPRVKPRLRGVSHHIAFYLALVAGAILVSTTHDTLATIAAAVYSLSLVALFGISALYHRPTWGPSARQWMRRLDHAAIFLLIAGSYTPLCLLVIQGGGGILRLVWVTTLAGIVLAVIWPHAPKIITAIPYLLLSWGAVFLFPRIVTALGWGYMTLLLAGGIFYTVGAIIYALRRPDPLPTVFGYHEIFHALVIAASVCHFVVFASITHST